MTPGGRAQAAIGVLDAINGGTAAEKALSGWARRSRYAGSRDRAAVRDIVFSVLRCRRSAAAFGGGGDGRALVLGLMRLTGEDVAVVFNGEGYAPAALSARERADPAIRRADLADAVRLDFPDWLARDLRQSLGAGFEPTLEAMRHRAPVFLRANARLGGRDEAAARLKAEGIEAHPHPLAPHALKVTSGARRVAASRAFRDGWVELQDAASQAVVAALPLPGAEGRVLDYCAGGGGKALAMAAVCEGAIDAHDADPGRMADLGERARRAGVNIARLGSDEVHRRAPYDLVLCDVPCSGSGAWRRQPEAKWRLDKNRLAELIGVQARILRQAGALVRRGGVLAYATCSLLTCENAAQIANFLKENDRFSMDRQAIFTPLDGGDGLAVFVLKREY